MNICFACRIVAFSKHGQAKLENISITQTNFFQRKFLMKKSIYTHVMGRAQTQTPAQWTNLIAFREAREITAEEFGPNLNNTNRLWSLRKSRQMIIQWAFLWDDETRRLRQYLILWLLLCVSVWGRIPFSFEPLHCIYIIIRITCPTHNSCLLKQYSLTNSVVSILN